MPTLRKYANDPGFFVVAAIDRKPVTFQLTDQGSDHLVKTLKLTDRSRIPIKQFVDLVEKRWAYTGRSGPGEVLLSLQAYQQETQEDRKLELATSMHIQSRVTIRLEGGDVGVLDAVVKEFVEVILKRPTLVIGPIPLPTRIEKYKIVTPSESRFHEMRTHKRMIAVVDPDSTFFARTANLSIPPGIDLKVRETMVPVMA